MSEALLPVANRLSQTLPKPISNTGPDMHVGGVRWIDNIRGCDTHTPYHCLLKTLTGHPIDLD